MYEVYRVVKPFRWGGWHYGPRHVKASVNPETGEQEACACQEYAGDIWFILAGHPRKDAMLAQRFAVYDASIPAAEELLKEPQFKRLLSLPCGASTGERELVHAGPGRPRKG